MGSGIGKAAKQTLTQVKGALERIVDVENNLESIGKAVNSNFGALAKRIEGFEETLSAVIELVGLDQVQTKVNEYRIARATAKSEAEKATLQAALEAGTVVKSDAISENSIVVGHEVNADGTDVPPGRVQLHYMDFKEEFRGQLLLQAVGFELPTPVGGKFTVLEIYDIKENPPTTLDAAPAPDASPASN